MTYPNCYLWNNWYLRVQFSRDCKTNKNFFKSKTHFLAPLNRLKNKDSYCLENEIIGGEHKVKLNGIGLSSGIYSYQLRKMV